MQGSTALSKLQYPKMSTKSVTTSHLILLNCLAFLCLFSFWLSNAGDTLTAGEVMKDWEFLKSKNEAFKLLFFSPSYTKRYLGIQFLLYSNIKMVWVANRENPLSDTSGYLSITQNGDLIVRDEKGTSFVINSGELGKPSNTSLTLLDSGNLVLKEGHRIVWQSFDYPTDTILPGMKLGLFGLKLGQPRKLFLTSWVSPGVPAAGAFTLGVNPNNTKQLEVLQRGVPYWRSGNWNEREHSYFPFGMSYDWELLFNYTANENESYFMYKQTKYKFAWLEMNSTGGIYRYVGEIDSWENGYAQACYKLDYKGEGCIEQKPSKCKNGDEFVPVLGAMDTWTLVSNTSLGLSDCEIECRNMCECTAYGYESPDGSGCKFSDGSRLNDMPLEFLESFYIRNTTAQNNTQEAQIPNENTNYAHVIKETSRNKHDRAIKVGALIFFSLVVLICTLGYFSWKKCFSKGKRESNEDRKGRDTQQFIHELGSIIADMDESTAHKLMRTGKTDHELPLFSFSTIDTATGHFSEANKLGQGGFGPVYKGKLVDGQEIAVKRLSERSKQGVEEFKNEVVLISKVQHRNLVRLFGCCIKGEEKLLIYEYLPNKSLDTFLFDETKRVLLSWRIRMNIIEGIVQGLLYLHKYSRLKIIHRDLKTSNILLDNNMNPKISDFGTAKIFGDNESRANTKRIVGTIGYMSPEYAMDGLFSVKSDVFSFGVMMLEIISGKKSTGFYQSDQSSNLVRYAWNLWIEERSLELMDSTLAETCSTNEFVKCIQVALLCVQENAADRPTMSDVVALLGSDIGNLPQPKQSSVSTLPGMPKNGNSNTINDITISSTYAR